ncbi:MAG: hypothetical protein JRD04_12410 [Deltaproteobacteria bacterium]|nr:hypothetical protein [Deltaproteobacteria bacterium]
MSEVKEYPLEYSLRGDNTIYVACESVGRRCNYAICTNILKAMDEGRRKPEDPCSREIKSNQCEAKVMRAEEVEAGYAVHYTPRVDNPKPVDIDKPRKDPLLVDRNSEGFKRGYMAVVASTSKKPKTKISNKGSGFTPIKMPVKKASVKPDDIQDFSSAISQEMKEEIVAPKQEKVIQPVKKESALERARRIRAGG